MDVRKILVVAAILLIAIIGYNYYSSMQSKESRAARTAEIEALRAKNAQAEAQNSVVPQASSASSQPATRISSDEEIAAANKEIIDAANKEKREASNVNYAASKASIDASKKQICDSVTSISETAMKARLNGVPIQTTLSTLDSANNGSDAAVKINKIYTAIVTDAYRKPNFSTDKYKEEAIREFALANYLACIDAVAKW